MSGDMLVAFSGAIYVTMKSRQVPLASMRLGDASAMMSIIAIYRQLTSGLVWVTADNPLTAQVMIEVKLRDGVPNSLPNDPRP